MTKEIPMRGTKAKLLSRISTRENWHLATIKRMYLSLTSLERAKWSREARKRLVGDFN